MQHATPPPTQTAPDTRRWLALAVALAPRLLDESRDRGAGRSLDLWGALSVTSGLALLVYGLTQAEAAGWTSARTLGVLGLALALLSTFWLIEGRVRAPLVPLRIFRRRTLAGANLVALSLTAVIGAHGFFSSIYMQRVLGYSPVTTGLAFLPITATIMAVSSVGARFVGRAGTKRLMIGGMLLLAGGMLCFVRLPARGDYLTDLLPGNMLLALGMGLTFLTVTIAATAGVGDEEQGVASGLINTAQQIGSALGLALLVSLASSRTATLVAAGGAGESGFAPLVAGFRWAFGAGAGIAALGALLVVREDDCVPQAALPEPATAPVPHVSGAAEAHADGAG